MPNPLIRTTATALGLLALATSLLACVPIQTIELGDTPGAARAPNAGDKERPGSWSEKSHSNNVAPN